MREPFTEAVYGEMKALEHAAETMRAHGVDVTLPWDGDLDDREQEIFWGMVSACRAYVEQLRRQP